MPFSDPIATLLGEQPFVLTLPAVFLRVAASLLLSAVIGCERSSKRHSAGLRTFMLVSLACTLVMILDIYLDAVNEMFLLSAGAIVGLATISINSLVFSSKSQIKGLTTAVALWTSGLVGLTLGAGFYTATLAASLALICGLSLFPKLEAFLKNRSNHFELHLELKNSQYLQDFVATLRKLGVLIDDIELNPAYIGSGLSVYSIAVSITSGELKKYKTHREIIEALASLDYIYHIEEMRI